MPLTERLLENDYDRDNVPDRTQQIRKDEELRSVPIRHAAYFLHEGRLNLHLDEHPTTKLQLRLWIFLHLSWFTYFDLFMSVLYLLLALVENPAVPGLEDFPEWAIVLITILCLSTLLTQLIIKFKIKGTFKEYKIPKGMRFQFLVALLLVVDLIIYLLQRYAIDHDNVDEQKRLEFFHVLRALRPLYFLSTDLAADIRRVMRQIMYVCYEVFEMLFFLFFYVGVFAVAATYMFRFDKFTNFDNLGDSYTQLFILITTCNYPTVMLPQYRITKWTFFFFFFFILIGIYFILNLLLAIVYRMYTEQERRKFRKLLLKHRTGIRHAYNALTRDGELNGISRDIFKLCMKEYDHGMSGKMCSLLFSALDRSNNGLIGLEEFYNFYMMYDMKWRHHEQMALRHRNLSIGQWGLANYSDDRMRWLQRVMRSKWTETFHWLMVTSQSVYLTVQCANLPSIHDHGAVSDTNKQIEMVTTAFLLYFTVEAIIKIAVLNFWTYWRYKWHQFDTVLTVFGWLFVAIPSLSDYLAPLVILRSFRLTSFLLAVTKQSATSTFKNIANTAFLIIPAMVRFGAALFLVTFYSFSIFGMTYLSDSASNCATDDKTTCGLPYANITELQPYGGYQEMNFNNIRNSYVTLFTLMVVNDWNNTMAGHKAMLGTWARAYFMLNYVFTVLIVVNVILAYVLEMFQIVVVGQQVTKTKKEKNAHDPDAIVDDDEGGSDFLLSDIVEVKLSRAELVEVCDPNDADLKRLDDPTTDEYRSGFVEYHGKVRITQFALYRLLYADNIEKWIAQDQAQTRSLSVMVHDEKKQREELRRMSSVSEMRSLEHRASPIPSRSPSPDSEVSELLEHEMN